eukprot:363747-Chlamydomonas_euryale.AAC.7
MLKGGYEGEGLHTCWAGGPASKVRDALTRDFGVSCTQPAALALPCRASRPASTASCSRALPRERGRAKEASARPARLCTRADSADAHARSARRHAWA